MSENNNYRMGLRDGLPIGIGYFAISFAFGLFSTSLGLSWAQSLLISMFNLTSAGQIAAVPIIAAGGSLFELALTQLVINARYALMSVSLSQRLSPKITMKDRFLIAFVNTDEIFAVACGKNSLLGRRYIYSLALYPYIGWSVGTLFGALIGSVLPEFLTAAFSVALYSMFIAILMPAAKASMPTALCIFFAIVLSSAFEFIPVLSGVHSGIVIVIIALSLSAIFAILAPVPDNDPWREEAVE
jgi:4-azaleucine resistance transporter AzlC